MIDFIFMSLDSICVRIADLRQLGFADPVKMITSSPEILGFAIDNIRGKIANRCTRPGAQSRPNREAHR